MFGFRTAGNAFDAPMRSILPSLSIEHGIKYIAKENFQAHGTKIFPFHPTRFLLFQGKHRPLFCLPRRSDPEQIPAGGRQETGERRSGETGEPRETEAERGPGRNGGSGCSFDHRNRRPLPCRQGAGCHQNHFPQPGKQFRSFRGKCRTPRGTGRNRTTGKTDSMLHVLHTIHATGSANRPGESFSCISPTTIHGLPTKAQCGLVFVLRMNSLFTTNRITSKQKRSGNMPILSTHSCAGTSIINQSHRLCRWYAPRLQGRLLPATGSENFTNCNDCPAGSKCDRCRT